MSILEDKSLTQFCIKARYAHKNPGKGKGKGVKLTDERIAAFDALGFNWTSHVTRSFDERIKDLVEYKQTHIHLSVKKHEDNSLYRFSADVRYSLKKA